MRGITKPTSMRNWLDSPPPGARGGGRYLGGAWKGKDGKGHLDTFLHVKRLPMTAWRHVFPMLIDVKDKTTGLTQIHVWGRQHTCHETEDVLDKLYWRVEKGVAWSERDTPPERCGMCKFAEWLCQESWAWINSHEWDDEAKAWKEKKKGKGKGIDPCSVLFKFISEADDKENTVIHVGGYCGLFGGDDKKRPADLAKAMLVNKIRVSEAWKENCMVKPKSVMAVLNNDKPEAGVQISEEAKELGEKVKEEITKIFKSLEIDIQKHPFCIRWDYDKSKQLGKQYEATAMMKIKPSPRVLAAIRGEEPDMSEIETPFNQQMFRAIHEQHCKLPKGTVPWDEIFPSKEQEKKWAKEDAEAEKSAEVEFQQEDDNQHAADDAVREEVESDDPAHDAGDKGSASADDDGREFDKDGVEIVLCENADCEQSMRITDSKCAACGKVYEVADEPAPEPPKKKIRSRSEALADAKKKNIRAVPPPPPSSSAPAAAKRESSSPPSSSTAVADGDVADEDDIPF